MTEGRGGKVNSLDCCEGSASEGAGGDKTAEGGGVGSKILKVEEY